MNKTNWESYKFHCSALGYLMTNGRSKSDPLSETAKRYLEEVYLKEVWGRERHESLCNKYMQKGIMCETDSLELFEEVTGNRCFKNQKNLSNEYITGTPDVIKPELIDIKTSWDLHTFIRVTDDSSYKDYYYQLFGYMWLTNMDRASLVYCLVNTPNTMVNDEIYRLSFKVPEEKAEEYRNNFIFDDIPPEKRIKRFDFDFDDNLINQLKGRIELARIYLAGIEL